MKESARAALSWLRRNATGYGIDPGVLQGRRDPPARAVGRDPQGRPVRRRHDGDRARVGADRRPVRGDVAMTGEITLSGRVLPVGGIKEKVLAARRVGIRTVILPRQNEKSVLEDIGEELRRRPRPSTWSRRSTRCWRWRSSRRQPRSAHRRHRAEVDAAGEFAVEAVGASDRSPDSSIQADDRLHVGDVARADQRADLVEREGARHDVLVLVLMRCRPSAAPARCSDRRTSARCRSPAWATASSTCSIAARHQADLLVALAARALRPGLRPPRGCPPAAPRARGRRRSDTGARG